MEFVLWSIIEAIGRSQEGNLHYRTNALAALARELGQLLPLTLWKLPFRALFILAVREFS